MSDLDFKKTKDMYDGVNYDVMEIGIEVIGSYSKYFEEFGSRYRMSGGMKEDDIAMFDSMNRFHRDAIMSLTNSQHAKRWQHKYGLGSEKSFQRTFTTVGGCPYIGSESFSCWMLRMSLFCIFLFFIIVV